MPNHCYNYLTIEFDSSEEASAFRATALQVESIARTIRPMPAILEGTTSPDPSFEFDVDGKRQAWVDDPDNHHWTSETYIEHREDHYAKVEKNAVARNATGYGNWYDWASENWGTKWGDYGLQLDEFDGEVTGQYTTAWGPLNESFWVAFSEKFPTAKILITFEEPGMGFNGAMSFYDGECLFAEEGSILGGRAEAALYEAVMASR